MVQLMDQAGFQPTIMTVLQEDGVYSFLVDNDDKIIIHPNKDYDGKHKLLIVSTVPSTNWKVGIVIPDDIFKKELSGLITLMIFIIFATLAIVITAAVIASNKITKPIITLTEIINRTKDFEIKDKVVLTFSDISSATEEISASAQEILTSVDYQKESVGLLN